MSHLGFVRLPASLCVGILLLPHLALVIEALAPLTSLDVEAIGVNRSPVQFLITLWLSIALVMVSCDTVLIALAYDLIAAAFFSFFG